MKISAAGIEKLIQREGIDRVARLDGIRWTIGHGNTYYPGGKPVKRGDTITAAGAKTLLVNILPDFEPVVNAGVKVPISQNSYDALVSFAWNVGSAAFRDSTLLKYINTGRTDNEIAEQFRRWKYSGGKVLTGLVNRRESEITQYFSGSVNPTGGGSLSTFAAVAGVAAGVLILKSQIK